MLLDLSVYGLSQDFEGGVNKKLTILQIFTVIFLKLLFLRKKPSSLP